MIDLVIMLGIISRSPPSKLIALSKSIAKRHIAYNVARSTNGQLPVYTDIRTGGTRYLVIVKNISGDVQASMLLLYTHMFSPAEPGIAQRPFSESIPPRIC